MKRASLLCIFFSSLLAADNTEANLRLVNGILLDNQTEIDAAFNEGATWCEASLLVDENTGYKLAAHPRFDDKAANEIKQCAQDKIADPSYRAMKAGVVVTSLATYVGTKTLKSIILGSLAGMLYSELPWVAGFPMGLFGAVCTRSSLYFFRLFL